ncbi:MAG: aminopeptidase [Melioribacteraceae bacterium]|nr:aminopeptidase [Melioribacteraceae bacterium]
MRTTKAIFIVFILSYLSVSASDNKNKCPHEFKIIKQVAATPVKNQGNTGTCWSFATTSFLESELLRMGKGEYDLSEMFFVRLCYIPKAEKYIRYHGDANFGEGGQAHDVMMVIKKHGLVPQSAYEGITYEKERLSHGEMTSVLRGALDGVLKRSEKTLTPKWLEAYTSVLDIYMGTIPEKFEHLDSLYTPQIFTKNLEINTDDYIEFTSYTSYPFYEKVKLEVPDNWSDDLYYNLPIDELIKIINSAIETGYSVCWDGDTGRDHFLKEGYAVVPSGENRSDGPEKEKIITQQMRQETFDNFSITDDHLMHLVGLAENQEGTMFYYTKNSWGADEKGFDGYWYMSEQYVRLKTVAIMVHKNAVPTEIIEKFNR